MYKIGDFAKLVTTSIRTLRYYDNIDLFKPDDIDIYTNYRYYSESKVEEFEMIKRLQEAGFTLEEIKKHRNHFTNDIFLNKKDELLKEMENVNKKIKEIDYLRSHIVDGKIRLKEIEKKQTKEIKTLIRRDI